MKSIHLWSVIGLYLGLSLSVCAQSSHSSITTTLDAYLQVLHQRNRFSGEIFVMKGGDTLYREAVGKASYEHDIALKPGAKYKIASITKTFTGALIAMAEQEGKLSVSDRASSYLSDLAPRFADLTIEQLVTHTSGLPHNEGIRDYWQVKSKQQLSAERMIAEINELELLFPPGTKMNYSSPGYYLLAAVLEAVYQQNYGQLLREKILDKLDMSKSGTVDDWTINHGMVTGYHLVSDDSLIVAPYRNYSMLKGAGDLYATATDLMKWMDGVQSSKIIHPAAKAKMFGSGVTTTRGNREKYGYGWYVHREPRLKYYHGGGTWGYSTHLALYPNDRVRIVILSNVSTLPISGIAEDVEKIVFGLPFTLPVVEMAVKNPVDIALYPGNYTAEANGMALTVTGVDDRLYAKLGGNPPFEIYPMDIHRFFGKKVEVNLTFQVSEGIVTGLLAERSGQSHLFTRDTP